MTAVASSTVSSTRSSVGMARRIRSAAERQHYRPNVAVTPERWLAQQLGRTPDGVHQLLYAPFKCGMPLNELTALCLTSFVETAAHDRLSHWAAPIRAAFAKASRIEISASLFRTVRAADAEDDKSQTAYIVERTPENGMRLVADIDRTVARLLELRAAVVTEQSLERQ